MARRQEPYQLECGLYTSNPPDRMVPATGKQRGLVREADHGPCPRSAIREVVLGGDIEAKSLVEPDIAGIGRFQEGRNASLLRRIEAGLDDRAAKALALMCRMYPDRAEEPDRFRRPVALQGGLGGCMAMCAIPGEPSEFRLEPGERLEDPGRFRRGPDGSRLATVRHPDLSVRDADLAQEKLVEPLKTGPVVVRGDGVPGECVVLERVGERRGQPGDIVDCGEADLVFVHGVSFSRYGEKRSSTAHAIGAAAQGCDDPVSGIHPGREG